MISDKDTAFGYPANAFGGLGTTINVGDVVDTGGDGINDVDDLYLVVEVSTAFVGVGASVNFLLVSDVAAPLTIPAALTHAQSGAIGVATLVAGYKALVVELPRGQYDRYLGIQAVSTGAATTAGAVNAFLTHDPSTWKAFKAGI